MKNPNCELGFDPEKNGLCTPAECKKCGWNTKEALRRKNLVRTKGLSPDGQGLQHLDLRHRAKERPKKPIIYDADTIFALWNDGLTAAEISEKLGCSKNTVSLRLREKGVVQRRRRTK